MLHTPTSAGPVAASLAVTRDDIDEANRLVHDAYVARGLRDAVVQRRAARPRSAVVFVARIDGAVGATLSLLEDSSRGLPVDALYRSELAALRADGRRLAEVGALAVDRPWRGATLTLMRPLVQLVGIYARDVGGMDDLCIAVHPRHAPFYVRGFGFTRFGVEKAYGAVKGAPAVGLRLDLHRPPVAGALSGVLFRPNEIARIRAALDVDLRRRAAAVGPLVQMLQFGQPRRAVERCVATEVC